MTTWTSLVKVRGASIALILGVLAVPVAGRGAEVAPPAVHGAAIEGSVTRIQGAVAVVDLGSVDGIEQGDRVALWQEVKGRRVRIGEARVVRVSEEECQVGLRRLPKGSVRVGDIVVAEPGGWAEPLAEPPEATSASPVVPPPPAVKAPPPPLVPRASPVPRVAHDPVARIAEGTPLQVSLVVVSDPPLAGATLYYRKGRAREWDEAAMERTGDAGWSVTIPGAEVTGRTLAYYVRGTDPEGRSVMVFAGPRSPWKVAIESRAEVAGGRRAGGTVTFEWQEFYLHNPNTDAFWRTELGFEYRVQRGVLHALRGGFGGIEGIGGKRVEVEADAYRVRPHRAAGYAWFETAFRFGRYVRWTPRLMLGVVGDFSGDPIDERPVYERGEVMGGASSLLEFGPEDVFSIGLKGSFLVPIGTELAIITTVQTGKGFQAGLSIGGTSFPVHADWAGQVMLMGGWHGLEWMSVDVKLGVNVRSTEHAGLGGGLGLSFWW